MGRVMLGGAFHFGRLTLGFLAVTLISGIALIPHYDPGAPLASVEAIDGGVSWGWLLRGIHGFAAHGLTILTIAHLVEVVLRRREGELATGVWWRSVLTVPLVVAAMLTGFVMRGDAEGLAALQVWRGIVGSIPLVGDGLADFLLGSGDNAMAVVALHHVGTFTLLAWWFAAEHGRRLAPDLRAAVLACLITVTLAGLAPLGLGPAAAEPGELVTGPWYLLGLQGALLDLPPAVGWLAPLLVVVAIGGLRHYRARGRAIALTLLAAVTVIYLGFTVRLLAAT